MIALLASLLGVAILVIYLRRFEEEASGGEPVKILIALKPIESGKVLTDDLIATRSVPRAYVEDRAIHETERSKVIGLKVGRSLNTQQGILWTDLAIATEERRSLSSLVQPGMRAVTIRTGADGQSLAFIRPGDRIDVLATMPDEKGSAGSDNRAAVVLLQNVLVLAADGDTGGEPRARELSRPGSSVLSLSLSVTEAQLLALAMEKGRITAALRNSEDIRVTEGIGDINSSALWDTKARGQAQGNRRPGPIEIK
ncbi:Flp pilus assembly protein CpaB [Sorangium sp. So ce1128]